MVCLERDDEGREFFRKWNGDPKRDIFHLAPGSGRHQQAEGMWKGLMAPRKLGDAFWSAPAKVIDLITDDISTVRRHPWRRTASAL